MARNRSFRSSPAISGLNSPDRFNADSTLSSFYSGLKQVAYLMYIKREHYSKHSVFRMPALSALDTALLHAAEEHLLAGRKENNDRNQRNYRASSHHSGIGPKR